MIDINNLKNILRGDYAQYIRPLVIKDKCDLCGNDKELEVHHTIQFSELFYETLKELNLEKREYFKEDEENLIRNIMLGKQVKPKISVTLCCESHDKTHNNIGLLKPYLNHLNSINKRRKRKRSKKDILWKMLNDYCESNVKIFKKDDKEKLINVIDVRDDRNRQLRSISKINEYLKNIEIGFKIISKKGRKGETRDISYWVIIKTN